MNTGDRLAQALRDRIDVEQRSRIARGRVAVRRPTATLRMLPDFLVVGTMRGGSSSLYRYLGGHPEVARPMRKEVEYFTRYFDRGERWYRQHFQLRARTRVAQLRGRRLQAFEATPYYLFHPRAAGRAADLLPGARIVVMLRDPVERAYSHYRHMSQLGFEQLGFAEAIEAEGSRLAPELERMEADPGYFSRPHHRFSYLARGRYAEQLERWLACYPRSSLLVVESDDLYAHPEQCFGQITDFLGLSDWRPEEFRNFSRLHTATPSRIDEGLRRELYARFEDDDRRLVDLWGRPVSWRAND